MVVAPGIEKLGRQHYRVYWNERGTGRRRSKTMRCTLDKAIAFRASMIDSQERGAYVSPDALTLGQYVERWLERHETMGETADSTHERYAQLLGSITAHLGDTPLQQLAKGQIEDYYAWCLKHEKTRRGTLITGDTVHKRHVILKRALEDACHEEPPLIQRNPASRAKHPPAARPHGVAWTSDEAQVVAAAVNGSWVDLQSRIALRTGLRLGEVLGLRWRDLHLPADGPGTLVVSGIIKETKAGGARRVEYGKTSRSRRTLALDVELTEDLREHRKTQGTERLRHGVAWQDNGLVMCGSHGQLLRPSKVSARFTPIVRMLEDEGAIETRGGTFHSWRHTHATLLLRAGVPVHIVSARLGHSRIQITLDYYGHVIPSDDEALAGTFAGLVARYEGATIPEPYPIQGMKKAAEAAR